MKFIFNSSLDSVSIGAFRKLRVYREENHVMLEVTRLPAYGTFEEVFTTFKAHKGRLYFAGDGLYWQDEGKHLGAGGKRLRFYSPKGHIGSSKNFRLEASDREIALIDLICDLSIYSICPPETGWIDVC